MTWQNPKVDWDTNPKNPKAEDLKRIEGNIDFLKTDIETKKGLIVNAINTMGQTVVMGDAHTTLANKIKAISTDATAGVGDVKQGKTFYQGGVKKTGIMEVMEGTSVVITPKTTNIGIPAGYHDGSGYVVGDSDLISSNIKSGVNIFGVAGNSNVVDTSAGNATAAQILSGKKAYVDGALVTGSIPSKGTATITPGTSNQTISSGQYLSGTQTILGDADLVAGNIRSGIDIFGVVGNVIPKQVAKGSFTFKIGANTITGIGFTPDVIVIRKTGSYYSILILDPSNNLGGNSGLYHKQYESDDSTHSISSLSMGSTTTFTVSGDGASASAYWLALKV